MKIISCYNLKGGVGKTTINNLLALNIAQEEISDGKGKIRPNKVLLIDADAQANLTSFFYNIIHEDKTIVDALVNNLDARDVIIKAPNEDYPNVDFIPSNIKMSVLSELISIKNAKEKVAQRWFVKNLETLKEYTHIFIDLSPGTDIVNRNMLYVSDLILAITKWTDIASLEGCSTFIEKYNVDTEELELPKKANIKVILNQYTTKVTSTGNIFSMYLDNYPTIKELMLESKIHESVSIKNAIIYNKSIKDYTKEFGANKRSVEEFNTLIKELRKEELI